jgi:ubiquinone/menaquinone biosynthesis C-methylase UbiE
MPPVSLLYRLAQRVQGPVIRRWYNLMSRINSGEHMVFMNYGWASLDPEASQLSLLPEDEKDRYCAQLYDKVAGSIDLRGKDVLEIGCGRGGGASWIMRYLKPRTLTGLDFSAKGIEFCRQCHVVPGLSFVHGDAEELEFGPESFDVVINVESSHCYGSMRQFLAGVFRILKPGGYFLYTDYHSGKKLEAMRLLFAESGLKILFEEDISPNVLKALELDNERKLALINSRVPFFLRKFFYEFAGMEGTQTFNATMRTGEKIYSRFVLQSPPQAIGNAEQELAFEDRRQAPSILG